MMGEDCHLGTAFPGNNALSDILLLCCGKIREKVSSGVWKVQKDEMILTDAVEFEQMLKNVKREFGQGFTKNYREMPEGEFVKEILEAMEWWTFIKRIEGTHEIIFYPSAGKITGSYPEDYTGGSKDE